MKIALVGNLCGLSMSLAEFLCRKGVEVAVFTDEHTFTDYRQPAGFHKCDFAVNFIKKESRYALFNKIRKYDVVISFTGALAFSMREIYYLLGSFLPPVINVTTGSDITELAIAKGVLGMLYRHYLKKSDLTWLANYPWALSNVQTLKLKNTFFLPFPVDTDFYGLAREDKIRTDGKMVLFHPSNLDWGEKDNKPGRHSTKGNDRFLKAAIKAIKEGLPAQVIMLDRGPDKELAKEIVARSGVAERFVFRPQMDRDELIRSYINADVVVDQFDLGGWGVIALEAMACARPVMVYVDRSCADMMYGEEPPVLNCHTEDEIYSQLWRCQDMHYRTETGEKAAQWVKKHHQWGAATDKLLGYCRQVIKGDKNAQ
ncbi:MAG: glycosyltransferase family 4 protein [Candidatus Omnitrophica bacterium]|nr:glycosyltransferase family 4 protein [Candidatus Omnitrophota bacterium]